MTQRRRETLFRLLMSSACLNLSWEVVQLPLYTVWKAPAAEQTYDVLHCTTGDVMITAITLMLALVIARARQWPERGALGVWILSMVFAIAYTTFSEWLNVEVRQSWAYSELMPILPVLGIGLSPMLQWLVVPTLAHTFALRRSPWRGGSGEAPSH